MFRRLPSEALLNIDKTGHKENGQKFGTWCFRAQLFTLSRVSDAKHAWNLAKRFRDNGEAYFRFITTLGIDPTNNLNATFWDT